MYDDVISLNQHEPGSNLPIRRLYRVLVKGLVVGCIHGVLARAHIAFPTTFSAGFVLADSRRTERERPAYLLYLESGVANCFVGL